MIEMKDILNTVICGDCLEVLKTLPDEVVDCVITSPPYWGLRDYGTAKWEGGSADCKHLDDFTAAKRRRNRKGLANNANEGDGGNRTAEIQNGIDKAFQYKDVCLKCGAVRIDSQLGLEKTPEEYIAKMVVLFREVRRVLKKAGTLWLNLGDSYCGGGGYCPDAPSNKNSGSLSSRQDSGSGAKPKGIKPVSGIKPKDLCMIPARVALALQADGWWLRSEIVWAKPNPMPESVTDRPTKAHEMVYLLTKSGESNYWVNNKTGRLSSVRPAGTNGIEGRDWKWIEHSACKGRGCDNSRCVAGKVKTSLWNGYDYFYDAEAIKEEAVETNDARPRMGQGPNTQYNQKRGFITKPEESGLSPQKHGQNIETRGKRNRRSVWTIPTQAYSEAHFATFPEKLIEPMILAGCPKEVCSKCGKARERIVETSYQKNGSGTVGGRGRFSENDNSGFTGKPNMSRIDQTIGFTDCGCGEKFIPGLVLDPFMGSGTVGYVAAVNQRDYLGIELNPKYIEMAKMRIAKAETGVSVEEQKQGQGCLINLCRLWSL